MKKSAVHILPHVAAALPFNAWQRAWGGRIFLPFYHLVADEAPPHVRHLYPVRTIRQFRADLDFFLKHFEVVDLPAFFAYVTEEKPVKRPVSHLTFDDGLRECHDVIMPVLLEKGIPATFFLNPDFVDNRDLMFRYKASLLKESGRLFPQDPLMVSYTDRRRLDEWAIETGFSFSDWQARQQPYLTMAQIKTMQLHGFTFGAHSLDHPFYARITPEEQQRQTLESLAWVQQHLGMPVPAFAFPFTDDGLGLDFFTILREKWGGSLLTFGTAGAKNETAPMHFQRFAMERTPLDARKVLSAEMAYSVLRKIARKQTVHRK